MATLTLDPPRVALAARATCDREFVFPLELGLHLRPAVLLAKLAQRYACQVTLALGQAAADAKSMIELASLGVNHRDVLRVTTAGADADAAMAAIAALFAARFGEAGGAN